MFSSFSSLFNGWPDQQDSRSIEILTTERVPLSVWYIACSHQPFTLAAIRSRRILKLFPAQAGKLAKLNNKNLENQLIGKLIRIKIVLLARRIERLHNWRCFGIPPHSQRQRKHSISEKWLSMSFLLRSPKLLFWFASGGFIFHLTSAGRFRRFSTSSRRLRLRLFSTEILLQSSYNWNFSAWLEWLELARELFKSADLQLSIKKLQMRSFSTFFLLKISNVRNSKQGAAWIKIEAIHAK